jgi:hypothetical protein
MIVADQVRRRRDCRAPACRPILTEALMRAAPVHVEPTAAGRWTVRHENEREPFSEHGSATDAERVALAVARDDHAPFVVLHDRYARTHRLPAEPNPGTPSTRR